MRPTPKRPGIGLILVVALLPFSILGFATALMVIGLKLGWDLAMQLCFFCIEMNGLD
jgi:hypothetical protein